jgi:hypothetical protein
MLPVDPIMIRFFDVGEVGRFGIRSGSASGSLAIYFFVDAVLSPCQGSFSRLSLPGVRYASPPATLFRPSGPYSEKVQYKRYAVLGEASAQGMVQCAKRRRRGGSNARSAAQGRVLFASDTLATSTGSAGGARDCSVHERHYDYAHRQRRRRAGIRTIIP